MERNEDISGNGLSLPWPGHTLPLKNWLNNTYNIEEISVVDKLVLCLARVNEIGRKQIEIVGECL